MSQPQQSRTSKFGRFFSKPDKNVEVSSKDCNVSAGGCFYERASSRRRRHREALMRHSEVSRDLAVAPNKLGDRRSTPRRSNNEVEVKLPHKNGNSVESNKGILQIRDLSGDSGVSTRKHTNASTIPKIIPPISTTLRQHGRSNSDDTDGRDNQMKRRKVT